MSANDTEVGGGLTSVTRPANGTAVIRNGKILYTLRSAYFGAHTISYTTTDINGLIAMPVTDFISWVDLPSPDWF